MKKMAFVGACVTAVLVSSPAVSQTASTEFYVGAQAGLHELGDNPFGDSGGAVFGGFVGVDIPVSENVIFGVEGDLNFGSGLIDNEYGVYAKLGVRVGQGGQLFVRGGYAEVDLDLNALVSDLTQGQLDGITGGGVDIDDLNALDLNALGVDDSVGDYVLGVGGQFRLSDTVSLRAIVDTLAFDTVRATGGVVITF